MTNKELYGRLRVYHERFTIKKRIYKSWPNNENNFSYFLCDLKLNGLEKEQCLEVIEHWCIVKNKLEIQIEDIKHHKTYFKIKITSHESALSHNPKKEN